MASNGAQRVLVLSVSLLVRSTALRSDEREIATAQDEDTSYYSEMTNEEMTVNVDWKTGVGHGLVVLAVSLCGYNTVTPSIAARTC